ncbi:MAG: hypothetical protein ABSA21_11700 [Candidatus Limnocylindrales bacterium]|jgi:putative transposase
MAADDQQPRVGPLTNLHSGRTHSRPHVSNDKPYLEAGLKTLKYCPSFPERSGGMEDARSFCGDFSDLYSHERRHSGIGYPARPRSISVPHPRSELGENSSWPPPMPATPIGSSMAF